MDPLLERAFGAQSMGEWRLVPTSGNRLPTAASYLKRPGDTVFRAYKFDVPRVQNGLIAEITTFDERLFPQLGLPPPSTSGAEAMPQEISLEQLKSFLTKGTAPLSSPPPTLTAERTPARCGTPSMARTS